MELFSWNLLIISLIHSTDAVKNVGTITGKSEMRRQNQVVVYRQDGAIFIMEDAIAVAVAKNNCADVIHTIILQFLVKTRTTV